jgi:triphosphatase
MGIEFELKYRATPEILAEVAQRVTGKVQQYTMETTYYDTFDRALSRQHCTLRKRMENGTAVCTLKMPAKQGRAEFELKCHNIELAVPELCKLSGFLQLEAAAPRLQPICGARFNRTAITVEQKDYTVELALDEGILIGGGRELPLCELEVELKSGSREAAVAYAKALALRFGLVPEQDSKFRRASLLAGRE